MAGELNGLPHNRTIRLRLRDKHAADLNRQARAVNFVWNYCNEVSAKAWRDHRRWLTAYELQKLTAGSSKMFDIHSSTIDRVCVHFSAARDKARRGQIRWRSRRSLGWVPYGAHQCVSFDGINIRFRRHNLTPMHVRGLLHAGIKIGCGSFSQDARGHWYANLSIKIDGAPEHSSGSAIGIDLGLKTLATCSDGVRIEAPAFYRKSEMALATAQRARKTKRAKAIHTKATNRRRDFLHKASRKLANQHGLIVIGDVSSSRLARTTMAKSVLDAGWSNFKTMLSYKSITNGGRTLEVSERLTTQVCSECGALPASRPRGIADIGIREWNCDDCGTAHDRDVNAARNILRVGLDALDEGVSPFTGEKQPRACGRSILAPTNLPMFQPDPPAHDEGDGKQHEAR